MSRQENNSQLSHMIVHTKNRKAIMQNSTRRIIRNFINKHGRSKYSSLIEQLRQLEQNNTDSTRLISIAQRLELSLETVELMNRTLHNPQKINKRNATPAKASIQ